MEETNNPWCWFCWDNRIRSDTYMGATWKHGTPAGIMYLPTLQNIYTLYKQIQTHILKTLILYHIWRYYGQWKPKIDHHNVNFVITGGTGCCRNDNLHGSSDDKVGNIITLSFQWHISFTNWMVGRWSKERTPYETKTKCQRQTFWGVDFEEIKQYSRAWYYIRYDNNKCRMKIRLQTQ